MAGLILLESGVDWIAPGGLFSWVLEFIMSRVADRATIEHLREILDNNLGSFWLTELPVDAQRQVIAALRDVLVEAARRELPESGHKAAALDHLHELADLATMVSA